MGTELETNPETVADRLAAAGVRVRPLEWSRLAIGCYYALGIEGNGYPIQGSDDTGWIAIGNGFSTRHKTRVEAEAACNAHHAAAVLAMLEVVPSEEVKL